MNVYVESFLKYVKYERNYSDYTVTSYADDLRLFADFLSARGMEVGPESLQLDVVREWMAQMGKDRQSVNSIKRRLSCLRSLSRYLRRQGVISSNPLALLTSPKAPKPLPVWVNEEQMDYLLDDVDYGQDYNGVRDHLLIALLYSTGMRRSEAAGLRDAEVDIGQRQLKVLGKGNKERIIPFGQELATLISAYRAEREATVGHPTTYLLTDAEGQPLSPDRVTEIAHKYLSQLPHLSRRGAHVLRHSFATNMLAEGAGLMSVKELLGHASLQSTEVYTHLSAKDIIENYKQAHPRSK